MKAEQLRKAILQMAIQGKLVPQDPNDEPASVLLEKIRVEKQRLIKEGKIKKDKVDSVIFKGDDNRHYEKVGNNEPICIEDELPFEIPDSWEWVRLGNFVLTVFSGKSPKYSKVPTLNKVIGQQANQWQGLNLSYVKYCTDDFIVDMPNYYYLQDGDVLLNTLGNGTLGRSGYFDKKLCEEPLLTDGHLFVFRSYSNWLSKFLHIYLQIKYDEIVKSANGSTNQTFLNLSRTTQWLIPVPPLNEVEKIVVEIEKYEPLIAEYDKLELQKSKLDGEIYDKLKKSILQYAIQGKLVPQDESDEPASELLKRIRDEKKAQIGKKYVDSYIYKGGDNCYYEHIDGKAKDEATEVPFDLPDSWSWTRIQNISESYIGLTYKPSDVVKEKGNIVLRSSNIQNGKLDLTDIVQVNSPITEKLHVKKNDIIICARNGSKKLVGKSAIVDIDLPNLTFGAFMAICKTPLYKYTYIFLQSNLFFSQLAGVSGTTTINQLTQASFNSFLIPIPSLDEQKRIVNKINEMFAKL